jgi:hypothetical protein
MASPKHHELFLTPVHRRKDGHRRSDRPAQHKGQQGHGRHAQRFVAISLPAGLENHQARLVEIQAALILHRFDIQDEMPLAALECSYRATLPVISQVRLTSSAGEWFSARGDRPGRASLANAVTVH